jgi:hypothetical protein
MALIPEFPWQQGGIKVPISQLMQKVQGRPCNGLIEWEINTKNDRKYVNNNLTSIKPFDQGITQPVVTEGNPPTVVNDTPSAISQQAASGVTQSEVNEFLNQWPGGEATASTTPAPSDSSNFFDEPF